MTNETFSDRLKLAMQAKQFKQVDLIRAAQRRGVKLGKSHVSQYVSGKTVPRSDILHFLADVLQVDPDWLLAKDSTVKYTADTVSDPAESFSDPSAAFISQTKTGGSPMREFKKSSKLDNVLYPRTCRRRSEPHGSVRHTGSEAEHRKSGSIWLPYSG